MKDKKALVIKAGIVILNVIFYLSSFLYHFIFFYGSRPSDLTGFILTVFFLASYILLIFHLKQVKAVQWILLALSIVSIISAAVMWAANLSGANIVTAYLTGLVVMVITPLYGISFLFGTGASYLIVLSSAIILLLLLKLSLFIKDRNCKKRIVNHSD